jgi:hypothetical protein
MNDMKLTLWQQFSGNHSSHFTVVGSFATESEARTVETQFGDLFRAIYKWKAIPENRALVEDHERLSFSSPATPPELEIATRYGIEAPAHTIDWLEDERDNLFRFDRDVMVSVAFETWQNPSFIQALMSAFGGTVTIQQNDTIYLKVHLTCDFPDEVRAQEIVQEAGPFIRNPRGRQPLWLWQGLHEGIFGFGDINVQGSQIIINHQFFRLHPGLAAMIQWLESQGATHITYTLIENPEW